MRLLAFFLLLAIVLPPLLVAYPLDGYEYTGITRLEHQRLVQADSLQGRALPPGAFKSRDEINLYLTNRRYSTLERLFEVDQTFQAAVDRAMPNLASAVSYCILDITPGRKPRYAQRKPEVGYQPGSVGKLAVITGFFCELENLFPNSWDERQAFLKNTIVRAGDIALPDHHNVPMYDVETGKYVYRAIAPDDEFSLYQWLDHVLSKSSNGAASVVWREALLMRQFQREYPVSEQRAEAFLRKTSRPYLADMANSVVNEPLQNLGIEPDEWRLGALFTRNGKIQIPGKGGSTGTPIGLMKWMVALESGEIMDIPTSNELKRLMYMTDRRIRYAKSSALDTAAVYFKSGSFYKCDRSKNPDCKKYAGNVYNYMNSIAIVEQPDNTVYLVSLMSNVLNYNSAYEHYTMARQINNAIYNTAEDAADYERDAPELY